MPAVASPERHALLPPQATKLEVAMSQTMDRTPELVPGLDALRDLKDTPSAAVVPFLIAEYGLEEIEEFFPVRTLALAEGLIWRRLVGTPEAVRRALVWIGYRAAIEDQWIGRRRWNTFQFRFPELPGNDAPDLAHVAKIAEVSTPLRSHFRRGVFAYDATALDGDTGRLDGAMLDRESGHALAPGGPLWSFGRTWPIDHAYSAADGAATGNWLEPVGDDPLTWEDMTFPWEDAMFPWTAEGAASRRTVLAGWFAGRALHACLRDGGGAVIGYCRCRAAQPVRVKIGGPYSFGATAYEPRTGGELLYVEAQTDFGAASGITAKSVSLIVGGAPAPGIGPGRLWLAPGQLVGGAEFAATPVTIPLRATVRDRIKFLVRF